ncbi:MAG: ABC-F family ATP-binding cassette domain-containing protein [Chloroflexota bacterium]
MSLIAAFDLAKSYGAQDVFEGVTVAIPHQARIALIGPNGIGKTTLLRLLAGLEATERGQVQRARGLRIGFLPQEAGFDDGVSIEATLWEHCLVSFRELRRQEVELARLEAEMGDPRRAADALARYGPLQETFERAGGYAYTARIQQVLRGLGFEDVDFSRPLRQLSGGERTRAFLARLLLEDPDLLLLDEPTNHLDVAAVEWLEGWLKEWPGAVVVVSHDRYFLDRIVDTVWELDRRGVTLYRGGYTGYAEQRAERRSFQLHAYQAQQDHIAREREYIRRNIAGQNTRQARGRRKRLERLLREGTIERPRTARTVRLDLKQRQCSGEQVLVTRDLAIGYSDASAPLFRVPDLVLRRGECAAVLGPNGAGKTTLLRTLLGEIPPWSGEVRLGASLKVGYFAQAHEGLDPQASVLQEVLRAAPQLRPAQARDFLGKFLFSGDSVEKPVSFLSGGERGRLALAKLALEGANLLLLDEPTTHLDIPSQEVLQEAMMDFPGTILLVSHDRYLVEALATQVWAVSAEEGELTVHPGGYQAYREAWQQAAEAEKERRERQRKTRAEKPRPAKDVPSLAAVEDRVHELEVTLSELGKKLEQAGGDVDQVRRLGTEYAKIERELDRWLEEWVRLGRERDETA